MFRFSIFSLHYLISSLETVSIISPKQDNFLNVSFSTLHNDCNPSPPMQILRFQLFHSLADKTPFFTLRRTRETKLANTKKRPQRKRKSKTKQDVVGQASYDSNAIKVSSWDNRQTNPSKKWTEKRNEILNQYLNKKLSSSHKRATEIEAQTPTAEQQEWETNIGGLIVGLDLCWGKIKIKQYSRWNRDERSHKYNVC